MASEPINLNVHKTTGSYTIMHTHHLWDKALSLKACGLLSKMLALPDNWNFSIRGLASLTKDNKDSIQTGLNELREHGYLKITQRFDERGRFCGSVYDIYEEPFTETPYPEIPDAVKPDPENPPIINIKEAINQNTNSFNESIEKKDINSSNDSFISKEMDESLSDEKPKKKRFTGINPSKEEVEAYIKEKGYHITAESMINYYTDHGRFPVWRMANGNLVKDWKRCCGTFEDKWKERNENQPTYRRVNTNDPYREVAKAYDEEVRKQQEELHAKGRLSKADHDKLLEQLRESKGRAYQNLS